MRHVCSENQISQLRPTVNQGMVWRGHYDWLAITCFQLVPQSPSFTSYQGPSREAETNGRSFSIYRLLMSTSLIEMTPFNSHPQYLLPNWLQISSLLPLLSSLALLKTRPVISPSFRVSLQSFLQHPGKTTLQHHFAFEGDCLHSNHIRE